MLTTLIGLVEGFFFLNPKRLVNIWRKIFFNHRCRLMQKYLIYFFKISFCRVRTDSWDSQSQSVSLGLTQKRHRVLSFWKKPFSLFFIILRSSDFCVLLLTDTAGSDLMEFQMEVPHRNIRHYLLYTVVTLIYTLFSWDPACSLYPL